MLILLSCAKTMADRTKIKVPEHTVPRFEMQAAQIALQIAQYPADELQRLLRVNPKIALRNYQRFQEFHGEVSGSLPALLAYTGIVFKRLHPAGFTDADFRYAQEHLLITSFCYGLLRPLDRIKNYRLEGNVRLPEMADIPVFDYWKPFLTDWFICEIRKQGGILVNLASSEMKQLFDWNKVERAVQVITPEFRVEKNGKLSTVVIYTKMCRGEMCRYILKNRLVDPAGLEHFTFDGFAFRPGLSSGNRLVFALPG